MFTMKNGFEALNRARVHYCVISDYTSLPSYCPTGLLEILTTVPDDVVAIMGLIRKGRPEEFSMPDNPGLVINVYKKGNGVFPDVFEAAILKDHCLHNSCVKIPGMAHLGIMVLFRQLFHFGAYKGAAAQWLRRPLEELARQHTGTARRTKYKSLGFTP